jgi:outer membrane receptor protein involved in Fe transport
VVVSTDKAPVAEALVTVTSPALQVEQMVVTDKTGFYRVPNLPPGEYLLRVDKDNYLRHERAGINLRADITLRVNVDLIPEAARAEEAVVIVRPPNIDLGSSSVTTTVNEDMVRRVPIARPSSKGGGVRSFEAVAEAAPQSRADTYGVGISGTTSPENRYLIDGLAVNNPTFAISGSSLSAEFLRQVDVSTGGYMPEFGRSTGGVISATTKSGSNEIRGSAWTFATPGFLESSPTPVFDAGNTIQTDRPKIGLIADVGADIGFPIIKDKLWLYGGVQFSRSTYDVGRSLWETELDAMGVPIEDPATGGFKRHLIPGTESTAKVSSNSLQALVKFSYSPNSDHSITLTSVATPFRTGGGGDYAISTRTGAPEITPATGILGSYDAIATYRRNDAFDNQIKWTASLSGKRIVVDTTFGWHHEINQTLPSDGSLPGSGSGLAATPGVVWRRSNPTAHPITDFEPVPAGYCEGPMAAAKCPVSLYYTNSVGNIQDSTSDRYQARSVLSVLAQALGHHVIKVGGDFEYDGFDVNKAYAGANLYREGTRGTSFTDYRNYGYLTGPDDAILRDSFSTHTKTFLVGGFIQDSWSVLDKVTINAGLRYDAQYIYNTNNNLGLTLPNQFSPRVGFIWDPTQSGRAKIFGNYAHYTQFVPLDMADRSLSGESGIVGVHSATSCNPRDPTMSRVGGSCRSPDGLLTQGEPFDPNQKWGQSGGSITPIDPDLKANATDEIVVGGEYQVLGESRVGLSFNRRRLNQIIEDMSRDEATTYFLGNPGRGIAAGFPRARRDYDAITAYFSRNLYEHWLAQASYTVSWLYGNWSGLFRPETGQLDPTINSDFDLQSLLPNRTGPLPGDRRHQIKLFGAREFPILQRHLVTGGLGLRAASGAPTDYLGSHVVYGEDEVSILERGSGKRLPWQFSGDAQVSYGFAASRSYTISAVLMCFNVFNFQASTRIDETYTRADVLPVAGAKTEAALTDLKNADGSAFDAMADKNPNFGKVLAYQPPRVFQFGLRLTY